MLRREAERKAKEDEDRGSNNENDEELTFGFPICDIPVAFGRRGEDEKYSTFNTSKFLWYIY